MQQLITLAHGAGGKASAQLLNELVLKHLGAQREPGLQDAAIIDLEQFQAPPYRLAMTTDSFVVTPQIFPGGDIGALAVNGSINDLAMVGAIPQALSLGLILEEGLSLAKLDAILASAAAAARRAGVEIITGDTKVVERGAADQIYINTSGIGRVPLSRRLQPARIRTGDKIIVSGDVGRHGATILASRADLHLSSPIESDCAAMNGLVESVFQALNEPEDLRCLRDATRGGLATVLNELAVDADDTQGCELNIDEVEIPVQPAVQGLCELLGLDPFYLACEGRLVAVVAESACQAVLAAMHQHELGATACCIGEVSSSGRARVVLTTALGGRRQLDRLVDAQQPRIC